MGVVIGATQSPTSATLTSYVAAIDDSGVTSAIVDWRGNHLPGAYPFIGLAGIALREDHLAEFEARWNHLRLKIQRRLACGPALPPIHLKWMWGKHERRPDPLNPYVGWAFRDIKVWLRDARNIIVSFMDRPGAVGLYAEFFRRKSFASDMEQYFHDPAFADELAFFRSHKTRGKTGKLYGHYHSITANALVRLLAVLLWRLDHDVGKLDKTGLTVLVDRFAGANGIDAATVLSACQTLAGLSRISGLQQVPSCKESPLCQAADFLAYSYNRLLLLEHDLIERDPHFEEIAVPLLKSAVSLDGWEAAKPFQPPDGVVRTSLSIVYALAHHELRRRDARFVDAYMIPVEEFHERFKQLPAEGANGISILRAGVLETASEK